MKLSIIVFSGILSSGALAWAQSATTTYLTDVNGVRVPGTSSSTTANGAKTETWQSVNGNKVPLEQVVEKIVRDDASGKVVERTIRRFDASGQPGVAEKVVTEETRLPGGGSMMRTTTYRNDLNGNPSEAERKTVETRVKGSTTTAETVIARPDVNGSFATAEKRTAVTEGAATDAKVSTTESVYRTDMNGGYHEALRSVKTIVKNGDQTTESTSNYEPGVTGGLQLHAQSVATTRKLADGTEVSEVNLYASSVAGRLQDNSAAMRVQEQQIIERHTLPDGSVTETLSVRRPSASDPTRLGDSQKLSETVCTGKCTPDKPAATPTPAAGNSRP